MTDIEIVGTLFSCPPHDHKIMAITLPPVDKREKRRRKEEERRGDEGGEDRRERLEDAALTAGEGRVRCGRCQTPQP